MNLKKLSKNDWLKAAFRALTKGGPSSIKAEAIARDLGVSKGSFYWHFKNVSTLKSNMIAHWKEQATQAIIITLDEIPEGPQKKLELLILMSTSSNDVPYGGAMVEAAIRDWARYDESIFEIVEHVDRTRIKFVESLFQQCGLNESQSNSSAIILYSSLIGLQALSSSKQVSPEKELTELLRIMLSRRNN